MMSYEELVERAFRKLEEMGTHLIEEFKGTGGRR